MQISSWLRPILKCCVFAFLMIEQEKYFQFSACTVYRIARWVILVITLSLSIAFDNIFAFPNFENFKDICDHFTACKM